MKFSIPSLFALAGAASAASLVQVQNFATSNPTNTKMFIYVPSGLPAKPAIVVAVHHCQGTASSFFQSTQFAKQADVKKYIVIYPESPYSGTCFDVSSKAALTHGGNADTDAIGNMVTYAIKQYNADPANVHLVGASSGAMMANVMAAVHPELFKTVIAHSGVPAGCFMSTANQQAAWNNTCSGGNSKSTPEGWAKVVFDMYPGYTGSRPKMMIMHGQQDTTLAWNNYGETIKQWCGVFNISTTPTQTLTNKPQSGYTTYLYGDAARGTLVKGVTNPSYGHNIPIIIDDDLAWMGL